MQMNEEDLFDQLGLELERRGPGVKPLTRHERVAEARNWMARNAAKFAQRLCTQPHLKQFRTAGKIQDRVQLAAAILDLVAATAGVIAPATVSVLLAKEGLQTLCSEHASE